MGRQRSLPQPNAEKGQNRDEPHTVLAYNMKRTIRLIGVGPLLQAIRT